MRVKELADIVGVTTDTVRFYTRKEILHPRKRLDNGYKDYGERDVVRLKFVLSARQLGFTVNDILEIFFECFNQIIGVFNSVFIYYMF